MFLPNGLCPSGFPTEILYFYFYLHFSKIPHVLLSARHEKSAGSGVGMNCYAILLQKTYVHRYNTIRIHNALHYWSIMCLE
jgi:hypothetical protein